MNKNKLKSLSLVIAVTFALAACSTPNSSQKLSENQSNQNITGNNVTAQSSVSSQLIASDLTSYSDDEATFTDSEILANNDTGFATKALGDLAIGKGKRTQEERTPEKDTEKTVSDIKAQADTTSEARANMRTRLDAAGAITKNTDGSVTVNKDLLKSTVKQFMTENKAEIQAKVEKIKDKLKEKKEVAKEKAEKLKNKKAKAKTSNVIEVTNADGSVTKTMSVEFKSENMTKENIVSKTTKDGKMITMSHTLKITAKAFTKTASRIRTFNADGSKQIVTESVTTWTDGRKREVIENRTIDANGIGSGTGTITVTDKDGKVTTRSLDTKITVGTSGEEKVAATATEGQITVIIDEKVSGTTTVKIKEGDKTALTAEINVEEKEEVSAS